MNRKHPSRKPLLLCIAISLAFHLLAVGCLQRYSFWFSSPASSPPSDFLTLFDKDEVLKTAFETILSPAAKPMHRPIVEAPSMAIRSSLAVAEPENQLSFKSSFPSPRHDILASTLSSPSHPFLPETFHLLDHLPKELIIPVATKPTASHHFPIPIASRVTFASPPSKLSEDPPPIEIPPIQGTDFTQNLTPELPKGPRLISLPNLPKLPTLAELHTTSYSDSFDAELTFLPRESGGYIFALTLIPRPDLELPRLRQHFTFLIDRANSIQQGRLTATKAAIHKALEELHPDDTFDIIAFDSKMEKMASHPLPCMGKSFAAAEEFLEKIQLGSFFSTSDLYKPLVVTIPGQVANDELYTAILFTDGEAFAKKTSYRSILQDWTQYNGGRVTLHALAVNGDGHLSTLDAAAAFNRGKLSTAPTNRGLKRKLLKLLKMIQNPVGKNLSCTAISKSADACVSLLPKSEQLAPLYLDQPYVILGQTNTLDDFILFVQGRVKDRWLNIRKKISFLNAKKGGKELKEEWALQSAYCLYENYLKDANPNHLAEAQTLLEPYNYPSAFQ